MMMKMKQFGRPVFNVLLMILMVVSMSCLVWTGNAYAKGNVQWASVPEIYSDACILIDGDTGEVLFEKNSHETRYPASITKILTALITIEDHKLTDTVTLKGEALTKLPQGYVSFNPVKGEKLSVEDMLYALLMQSANDAGNGLAVFDSGSIAAFADKMNERAAKAGALDTHFTNPSGLHDEEHVTTAYDMAMIMKECIKHEEFNKIASDLTYTAGKTNKSGERVFSSHVQPLIESSPYYIEEVFAGKTGFTTPAGYTMVTAAKKDGKTLICVVLGCNSEDSRCVTTKRLFNYGFAYKNVDVTLEDIQSIPVDHAEPGLLTMMENKNFTGQLLLADSFKIPTDADLSDLDITISNVSTEAGTAEEHVFGGIEVEYTFAHDGESLGTATMRYTPLQQIDMTKTQEQTDGFHFATWKILWAIFLIIVFLYIVLRSVNLKKKEEKKEEKKPHTGGAATAIAIEVPEHLLAAEAAKEEEPENEKTAELVEELKAFLANFQDTEASEEDKAEIVAEVIEEENEDLDPEELLKNGESKDKILTEVMDLVDQTEDDTISEDSENLDDNSWENQMSQISQQLKEMEEAKAEETKAAEHEAKEEETGAEAGETEVTETEANETKAEKIEAEASETKETETEANENEACEIETQTEDIEAGETDAAIVESESEESEAEVED